MSAERMVGGMKEEQERKKGLRVRRKTGSDESGNLRNSRGDNRRRWEMEAKKKGGIKLEVKRKEGW